MTKFNFDIILYGGPAAGKGTQAEILRDKTSSLHLNMGAELRKKADDTTEFARALKKTMSDGELVPDSVSAEIAEKFIADAGETNIIIEGYPRSVEQAKDIDEILIKHGRIIKFVYLELPMEVAKARIIKRAEIEHRVDDMDADAVATRIEIFNSNAKSLLDYYQKSDRLITVDGDGDRETVEKRIFQILEDATDK